MSEKVKRRSFLKGCGAAIGGVAAAAAGVEVVTPLVLKEEMEFDSNTSLWAEEEPPKNMPLEEDIDVDVAIIGGGYTGLSSAYHLKKLFPKKSVVLLEAREVGHGGSGRNGGMILPQPFNEYMQVYSDHEIHKLTYELTVESLREMERLVSAQKIDADLTINGIMLVISKEEQVKEFQKYSEVARSLGLPIEFWDKEKTAKEIGTDVYYASLYEPNGGEVHPMKLIGALKAASEGMGAVIYEDSPVLEIEEGKLVSLVVGEGGHKVTAKAVVLATNGYTSKLGYFSGRVLPFHAQIAVTPPLPERIFSAIGWERRIPFSDTLNYLFHLGSTSDNRILIGGGNADYFFNGGITYKRDIQEVYDILHRELSRIYPALSKVEFEYIWSGVLGFSLDFNQSVGVMGENRNIYYGLAYCGHGVNIAFMFGKIIADIFAGDIGIWEKTPFFGKRLPYIPPEPLRWLGVSGYKAYYRAVDAL